MKWQLLLVCLVLGALLVGCDSAAKEQPIELTAEDLPETPKAAMQAADDALAALEKAVAGSDIEAVRKAVVGMNTALGGLISHLAGMDLQAQADARESGATQMPPSLADPLGPAMQAIADAHSAVLPPPKNDIATVKEAVAVVKSALDAVRDVAK